MSINFFINREIKREDNLQRQVSWETEFPYHIKGPETTNSFASPDSSEIGQPVSCSNVVSPMLKILPPTREEVQERLMKNWELQYKRRYLDWSQKDKYLQMEPEQQAKENNWRTIFESTFRGLSKKRGDSERQTRRANRLKSEYLAVICEDDTAEKRRRNAAVVPSLATCHSNSQDSAAFPNKNNVHSNIGEVERKRLNDFVATWHEIDIALFKHCLKQVGKNFTNIAMRFPGKTIKDCIQCYYLVIKRDNSYKSILPKFKKKMKAKYRAPALATTSEINNFQRLRSEQFQLMQHNQKLSKFQEKNSHVQAKARVVAEAQAPLLNRHLIGLAHSQDMQQVMQFQSMFRGLDTSNIFAQQQELFTQSNIQQCIESAPSKFERVLREIDSFIEYWKFKKSMLAFIPRTPENVKQIHDYLKDHQNMLKLHRDSYEQCRREISVFEDQLNEKMIELKTKESTCVLGMSLAQAEISQFSSVIAHIQQLHNPGFLITFPSFQMLLENNIKYRSQLQAKYSSLQAEIATIAADKRKIVEQIQKCAVLKTHDAHAVLNESIQYTSALLTEVSFCGIR